MSTLSKREKKKESCQADEPGALLRLTHLHADLSDGPGSIVAHRNELRVEVCPKDWHELRCRKKRDLSQKVCLSPVTTLTS